MTSPRAEADAHWMAASVKEAEATVKTAQTKSKRLALRKPRDLKVTVDSRKCPTPRPTPPTTTTTNPHPSHSLSTLTLIDSDFLQPFPLITAATLMLLFNLFPKGAMQSFVPRLYLTPVRVDEAESQRKAKSRHARQTRRCTQGVTLGDLREALKINHLSPQEERGGPKHSFTDDRREKNSLTEFTEDSEINSKRSDKDKEGNTVSRRETLTESPNLPFHSLLGSNSTIRVVNRWKDQNHNPVEDPSQLTVSTIDQESCCCDAEGSSHCRAEHDRLSRYDSSGESATDRPLGRTTSYTRRETRLSSLSKQDTDSTAKDYKKMYAEALHENERLKSRLQESKQELAKIRSQLEKVNQRHERMSERSTALESEKRDKIGLEKRVSDMEEEIKAFPALAQVQTLRRVNERLLAENRAMLRALARASETASMPETEDL
ncbi:protein phosphatase 1 regulatory subunit 12A-like [Gouania willdenowi]|uniref:protein phosphatase 1 regulatory subunit 12A-like n=1 Tax=Gouania willdenowi TaxID=441366 RepID=UPI00105438CA|nr:protein phosphatase 1 regulatory subunit 12A-like [Gouania willdenowi]